MAKIFSRNKYLLALHGHGERRSLQVETAKVYRDSARASPGNNSPAEDTTAGYWGYPPGHEHWSSRRKAYRHLEAYAGQFY